MLKFISFFGCRVDSFLNVCIYRLPQNLSIAYPRSFCIRCSNPIRAYDNIPLLSYLFLRGRCRHCGEKISWRYPLVEAISGGFALALFLRFGLSLSFFSFFAFVAAMVVIAFIDLDHRIIPDVISLPGIGIGFFLSFLQPSISVMESLIGLVAGGGTLFVVAWAYEAITKREGMGGGDVKLLAIIGSWPGWKPLFFSSSISKPSLGGGDFSPQAFGCFYPFRNNPFRVPDRLFLRGSIGHAPWQLRNFGNKYTVFFTPVNDHFVFK